jgi:hypothetical protein
MSDEQEGPPEPLSEEDTKMTEWWTALALMLGYNELAKKGETLGHKVYFRLLRDECEKRFVELGGNADVFAKEPVVVEIVSPHPMPHILFRAQDFELMRDAVHAYDVKRRGTTSDQPKGEP